MARNITQRLDHLNARRHGLDRLGPLSQDRQLEVLAKRHVQESYQRWAPTQPYTRYALGSMQEVEPQYTRISIEEAERIGSQIEAGLTPGSLFVVFRLQGSVPCNIHIRGVSDVDLLVLDNRFFTYDVDGVRSRAGHFTNPPNFH